MRLDEIIEEFAGRVVLDWRSFLLRPQIEERSLDAFTWYTSSWERPASLEPRTSFTVWASGESPPTHSLPTAVAGKVAETFGAEPYHRFHLGLMEAYFRDNRTISDRAVILDVADQAGIDPVAFEERAESQVAELSAAVLDDHNDAVRQGITAVPTVLVDGNYPLPGALDTDQYRRIVERWTTR